MEKNTPDYAIPQKQLLIKIWRLSQNYSPPSPFSSKLKERKSQPQMKNYLNIKKKRKKDREKETLVIYEL